MSSKALGTACLLLLSIHFFAHTTDFILANVREFDSKQVYTIDDEPQTKIAIEIAVVGVEVSPENKQQPKYCAPLKNTIINRNHAKSEDSVAFAKMLINAVRNGNITKLENNSEIKSILRTLHNGTDTLIMSHPSFLIVSGDTARVLRDQEAHERCLFGIDVTPSITPLGKIDLKLNLILSGPVGWYNSNNSKYTREFATSIGIDDEQVVVLGGFINDYVRTIEKTAPANAELLIFVSAKIIKPGQKETLE